MVTKADEEKQHIRRERSVDRQKRSRGRGLVILALLAIVGAAALLATGCGGGGSKTTEAGLAPKLAPNLKKGSGGSVSASCPSSPVGEYQPAGNVDAKASAGNPTKYTFTSLDKENPTGAVPGLIKYCVYPSGAEHQPKLEVKALGGQPPSTEYKWLSRSSGKKPFNFSFERPDGNKANIPLDGANTPIEMGTATWQGTAPSKQIILLHINDPNVCRGLYGEVAPNTCFVLPGGKNAPICDKGKGRMEAAFNAIPTDWAKGCSPPPSLGFQAKQTDEFGGDVILDLAAGNKLKSLTVGFMSFACQEGTYWGSSKCKSATGATFIIPASPGGTAGITAHIYKVSGEPGSEVVGDEIASATNTDPIPYRPSADPACLNESPPEYEKGSWYKDPVTGVCRPAISVPITFTAWKNKEGQPVEPLVESKVVWTVTFNTSGYGPHPFGTQPCSSKEEGCPYDSLNVGLKQYENSPYAGSIPKTGTCETEECTIAYWKSPYAPNEAKGLVAWYPRYLPLATIITGP